MDGQQKIKAALEKMYAHDKGRVNAARIFKGVGRAGYGWYVQYFGEEPGFLGDTVKEALEEIDRRMTQLEEQDEANY